MTVSKHILVMTWRRTTAYSTQTTHRRHSGTDGRARDTHRQYKMAYMSRLWCYISLLARPIHLPTAPPSQQQCCFSTEPQATPPPPPLPAVASTHCANVLRVVFC